MARVSSASSSPILRLLATLLLAKLAGACEDEHDNCVSWAASGECKNNPGFMKASCPKSCDACPQPLDPKLTELGEERVIVVVALGGGRTGEIELGFYPNAAPVTVAHITKLFRLRCFDTNHIFRVDKGFVAQIQSVNQQSVTSPLSPECNAEAAKTVPGEFTAVPHKRGILSMGRMSDPDSGGSSFSMLLGNAPHLDNQYTVFGKVLRGDEVLTELEKVKTKKEGIFVMPVERITITEAYVVGSERAPRHATEL